MREQTKKFVLSAVENGKDRKFVRESLFGKISDIETSEALNYFDRLILSKEKGKKISLKDILRLILQSIRLLFLFLVFSIIKIKIYFKKTFLGYREEISFREMEASFSSVKYFENQAQRFRNKPIKEKRIFLGKIILLLFFLSFLFYANFIFYKECENSSCFKEMVSQCNRARFVSTDLTFLENQIHGLTFRGCKIEVTSLENNFGIPPEKKMMCYLPYGIEVLPHSKIEFCTGELREKIQSLVISELYKTIGQNTDRLNPFFKKL